MSAMHLEFDWQAVPFPPGPEFHADAEAHVWLLQLNSTLHPHEALCDFLDSSERLRAAKFKFVADRHRYESFHGQARLVLGQYLGLHPSALQFEFGIEGKPQLTGASAASALSFNLSHSGDYAILGVTRHLKLGVDIEVVRRIEELELLAANNFATTEFRELLALAPDRRNDAFLACWTRKEAYVKALGGGLSVPLKDFEVSVDPSVPAVFRSISGSAAAAAAWTLWAERPTSDTWAAVAIAANAVLVRTFSLR